MFQVAPRILIGDAQDCSEFEFSGYTVVHACKFPCYMEIVGRQLDSEHPDYLYKEKNGHLYLNIIDSEKPLFRIEQFYYFLDFAIRKYKENNTLFIHCNMGQSRSPSLALLLMANLGILSRASYIDASFEFKKIYPAFLPGDGIQTFLRRNWEKLLVNERTQKTRKIMA